MSTAHFYAESTGPDIPDYEKAFSINPASLLSKSLAPVKTLLSVIKFQGKGQVILRRLLVWEYSVVIADKNLPLGRSADSTIEVAN